MVRMIVALGVLAGVSACAGRPETILTEGEDVTVIYGTHLQRDPQPLPRAPKAMDQPGDGAAREEVHVFEEASGERARQ